MILSPVRYWSSYLLLFSMSLWLFGLRNVNSFVSKRYAIVQLQLSPTHASRIGPGRLFATSKVKSNQKSKLLKATPRKPAGTSDTFLPIVSITSTTTEAEIINNFKELRKSSSHKKLLDMVKESSTYGLLNLSLVKSALKNLQMMNRTDLGNQVFDSYQSSRTTQSMIQELMAEPESTGFVLKWFCRVGNMTIVESLVEALGIVLPTSTEIPSDSRMERLLIASSRAENRTVQEFYQFYFADILTQVCLGYCACGQFSRALSCLQLMVHHGMSMELEISRKILKIFLRESNVVFARTAIRQLLAVGAVHDHESLQLAVNSFMRNIEFIKGAVSMKTLPPEKYGEVAFIGRSNVGKSSLINAISNRKQLAFTSKVAGKTSEFNYFEVTGFVGAQKEENKFYLIDLPGVGYAQKSKDKRSVWSTLMNEFTKQRRTLRCIFHLIDSRHGVLDADDECFDLLAELPEHVQYVVVFTKVDKLRSSELLMSTYRTQAHITVDNSSSDAENHEEPLPLERVPVARNVYESVQRKLRSVTTRRIPLLYTSSETKLGALSVLLTTLETTAVANGSNLCSFPSSTDADCK